MAKSKTWKKPVYVYVPQDFDPKVSLPQELQKHSDSARYFLHRIVWGAIQKRRTLEGYVPLKFDYLKEVIPSRMVVPIRDALVESQLIEPDGFYVEGTKSYGYRLGPRYQSSRIIRVRLEDPATAKKLLTIRRGESRRLRLPVHRYLRDNLKRLEVDLPFAMSLLKNHPCYELVKIPVERISNKEIEVLVCRYGRLHSEVTRCCRAVRPAFHFNGEPLCEIDVSSCQPLLLSLVMISCQQHGESFLSQIRFPQNAINPYKEIDDLISTTVLPFPQSKDVMHPSSNLSITTRMLNANVPESPEIQAFTATDDLPPKSGVNRNALKPDQAHFVDLCESGKLYRLLMDEMEWTHLGDTKRQFFRVLFDRNKRRFPLKTKFRQLFPSVATVIRDLKHKDHTYLSCLLQNIESHLIIHTMCRRIMTELPEAPVITIHDAILTTKPHVKMVRTIMNEEFNRVGMFPTLKIEDYGKKTNMLSNAPQ